MDGDDGGRQTSTMVTRQRKDTGNVHSKLRGAGDRRRAAEIRYKDRQRTTQAGEQHVEIECVLVLEADGAVWGETCTVQGRGRSCATYRADQEHRRLCRGARRCILGGRSWMASRQGQDEGR